MLSGLLPIIPVILIISGNSESIPPAASAAASPSPRPAVDDCECSAWERISTGIAGGGGAPPEAATIIGCRRDADCTGTDCSGKGPSGEIGPFNLTLRVFPCSRK